MIPSQICVSCSLLPLLSNVTISAVSRSGLYGCVRPRVRVARVASGSDTQCQVHTMAWRRIRHLLAYKKKQILWTARVGHYQNYTHTPYEYELPARSINTTIRIGRRITRTQLAKMTFVLSGEITMSQLRVFSNFCTLIY